MAEHFDSDQMENVSSNLNGAKTDLQIAASTATSVAGAAPDDFSYNSFLKGLNGKITNLAYPLFIALFVNNGL